jgi:hypothetical protein
MKIFINPYFIVCITTYTSGNFIEYLGLSLPYIVRNYYADILCLPIVLTSVLFILRTLRNIPKFILNKSMIFFAWLYLSVLFEFILPGYSKKYTQDYLDIAMYSIGALLFYKSQVDFLEVKT